MKALKFSTLLLGAALFLGLGSTTLSAQMKCGAGKCGAAMKAPKSCNDANCGTDKKCNCEKNGGTCTCEAHGKKETPKKAMKCGAGKCGGNK